MFFRTSHLQFREDHVSKLDIFWGHLLIWHLTKCVSNCSATAQIYIYLYLPSSFWPQSSAPGDMLFQEREGGSVRPHQVGDLYVSVHVSTPYNGLQHRDFFSLKLPLHTRSPCWDKMLAHVLGAIQQRAYHAWLVSVVPKFQQVHLILDVTLMRQFCFMLLEWGWSVPTQGLCSFAQGHYVLCVWCPVVMSVCVYCCVFFLL